MSSNNTRLNAKQNAKYQNSRSIMNPPIVCSVSHRISLHRKYLRTKQDILKISFSAVLALSSIISSIFIIIYSIKSNHPRLLEIFEGNGWSKWSDWSPCNISCSNSEQPFGTMTRIRYCYFPIPQQLDMKCDGVSNETTQCFKSPCKSSIRKTEEIWSEWSEWSNCSEPCQSNGSIPRQNSSRSCLNNLGNSGISCEGQSFRERLCTWLIMCPVINAQWGDWYAASNCEPINSKPCCLGKRIYERSCIKPQLYQGKDCEGLKEKNDDCWYDIGCPRHIQHPLQIQVFSNGSALFEIVWMSVPYGDRAYNYRIYLTLNDNETNQIETIHRNISTKQTKNVSGQRYSYTADLRQYMKTGEFETLVVRMSSLDFWGEESKLSNYIESRVTSVDGQWSDWDYWSECSTQCIAFTGLRTRRRKCDKPQPANGGKQCEGLSEENVSCMGMERDC